MTTKIIIVLAAVMVLLQGCATRKTDNVDPFPLMKQERPTTILVVPALNNTTAAEASTFYATTIAEPLSVQGYYVLPIELTNQLIQAQGIVDGSQLTQVDPRRFAEMFGADAVLFVTINEWDTSYYITGGNVTVGLSFLLRSTKTGNTLWENTDRAQIDTSGGGNTGLLGSIIEAAINTAVTDYVPIAKQVNFSALSNIPVGRYHKNYQPPQAPSIQSTTQGTAQGKTPTNPAAVNQ